MTLPPEPEPKHAPGGVEGSVFPRVSASLDPFLYQQMRWCVNCGGEQVFVEVFETEFGRVGVCLGCGEEKLVRFTRTMEAM